MYQVLGRDGNHLVLQNVNGGPRLKRLVREVQEIPSKGKEEIDEEEEEVEVTVASTSKPQSALQDRVLKKKRPASAEETARQSEALQKQAQRQRQSTRKNKELLIESRNWDKVLPIVEGKRTRKPSARW